MLCIFPATESNSLSPHIRFLETDLSRTLLFQAFPKGCMISMSGYDREDHASIPGHLWPYLEEAWVTNNTL